LLCCFSRAVAAIYTSWITQLANYALISILTSWFRAFFDHRKRYAIATAARGSAIVTVDALEHGVDQVLALLSCSNHADRRYPRRRWRRSTRLASSAWLAERLASDQGGGCIGGKGVWAGARRGWNRVFLALRRQTPDD